jgi:hypothetical protein
MFFDFKVENAGKETLQKSKIRNNNSKTELTKHNNS